MLDQNEIKRYARHLSLEHVGQEGQLQLKAAKVVLIGAGGLGAPILQYLTAAGVGTIGVVDHDTINESNLQRQVIFNTVDIGKLKVTSAIERMQQLNPNVVFLSYPTALTSENALKILEDYHIVIDGTDNFAARYLVNDACIILNKPFVHGSIFKFQGQVSVFNYQSGPSYRCLYPDPPKADQVPNCSEVGVLGVLPGVVGTRMATECLKMILGVGNVLNGVVEIVDLLENENRQFTVSKDANNFSITELQSDYTIDSADEFMKPTISVQELKSLLDKNADFLLLDVRETHELTICSFDNALHIPLNDVPECLNEIPKNKPIVAFCHHGVRSAHALNFLSSKGFDRLSNLEGGIHAWATQIDPTMKQY